MEFSRCTRALAVTALPAPHENAGPRFWPVSQNSAARFNVEVDIVLGEPIAGRTEVHQRDRRLPT